MGIITSRSFKVVVVCVALMSATLALLFGMGYALGNDPTKKTVITVKNVEELSQLSRTSVPIESGKEAISFAAYLPSVLTHLREAQSNIPYDGWKASAFFRTNEPSDFWYVTISSSGHILPSFTCSFSFTVEGNLIPKAKDIYFCAYNK